MADKGDCQQHDVASLKLEVNHGRTDRRRSRAQRRSWRRRLWPSAALWAPGEGTLLRRTGRGSAAAAGVPRCALPASAPHQLLSGPPSPAWLDSTASKGLPDAVPKPLHSAGCGFLSAGATVIGMIKSKQHAQNACEANMQCMAAQAAQHQGAQKVVVSRARALCFLTYKSACSQLMQTSCAAATACCCQFVK